MLVLVTASLSADQWPRFRGPDAAGVADGQALPVRWNVADGTNVRWKARLPGLGISATRGRGTSREAVL